MATVLSMALTIVLYVKYQPGILFNDNFAVFSTASLEKVIRQHTQIRATEIQY